MFDGPEYLYLLSFVIHLNIPRVNVIYPFHTAYELLIYCENKPSMKCDHFSKCLIAPNIITYFHLYQNTL